MQRGMAVVSFMTTGIFAVILSALFFVGWLDGTPIVNPSSHLQGRAEPSSNPEVKAVSSTSTHSSTASLENRPAQQSPAAAPPPTPTTSKPPPPNSPVPSKAPAASASHTSTKALSSSIPLSSSASRASSSTHSKVASTASRGTASPQAQFPSIHPSPAVVPSPSQSLANDSSSSSSILHDGQTTALVFTFVGIIAAFVVAGIVVLLWRRARALSESSKRASVADMEEFRGIRRANSTSTGGHRPPSTSGFSEPEYNWHYQQPQRFAASPIQQHPFGFQNAAADPVHYTIYPDILPPPQAARPVSPDSMYDDDSVYDGIQRRQQILQQLRERRI